MAQFSPSNLPRDIVAIEVIESSQIKPALSLQRSSNDSHVERRIGITMKAGRRLWPAMLPARQEADHEIATGQLGQDK